MLKFGVIFLLAIFALVHSAKHLTEQPTFLQPCKSKDNKCMIRSMQTLWSQLKTGIPGLSKIPLIDPLHINKVNIVQDQSQAVNVSAILTNADVVGMGDGMVKNVKYDHEKGVFLFDVLFPKLSMVSDYDLKGRILLLQLNGKGKMYMSAENAEARIITHTEIIEEDGERFINIKAIKVQYKLKDVKTRLENLFNGNKELEESANHLFNENWQELNVAFEPVLVKTAEEILLTASRRIFRYIPIKFIIGDI